MSWQEETQLRDLGEDVIIETCCVRCQYRWLNRPVDLLLRVEHRDVYLDEVARNLVCPRPSCRHVGVKLSLVRNQDTSGFVSGMP